MDCRKRQLGNLQPKGAAAPFQIPEDVMPQKSVAKISAKPSPEQSAKIVVFGFCSDDWPHAAWFPHTQAAPARAAANQLRLNVIEVTNGRAAELVAKLPPGQIHARGTGIVPRVPSDLYGKIVTALNPRGEAGQTPGVPIVTDLPASWDAIKPGHLVLTHESLVDGWWEAIVIDRTGDKVTLRMRDFPAYEPFTVPVTAVALMSPVQS
jgi:hypothetical protein